MPRLVRYAFAFSLAIICLGGAPDLSGAEGPSPEDVEFFEKKVRPVLVERCYACHSAKSEKLKGGLRLDARDAILRGGDIGPAAVPGEPTKSLLIEAVGFKSETIQMPPAGKLPDAEIAALVEWVRRGLPFPDSALADVAKRSTIDWDAGRKHWAFQPVREAAAATRFAGTNSADDFRTPIDPLVAAARRRHELEASPVAAKGTLIRRLKFDLLGLPPTPEEVDDFTADDSPDAYERLVDRWLAAPQLGERWGRFWLDLVRYCDIPEQWREGEAQAYWYRDWSVRAMNRDLSYREFLRQQLAADLLPDAAPEDLAALGFIGLGPTYWKELKLDHLVIQQVVSEEWEERIEALGGALLGLTLACARCHDHKFEPVSVEDYYALAGVFASTKQEERPIIPAVDAERAKQARARVKQLRQEADKLLAQKPPKDEDKQKAEALKAEADELARSTPHFQTMPAYGASEASLFVLPDGPNRTKLDYRPGQPQDVAIQIRGNPSRLGSVVPRRFLTVLSAQTPAPFREGSGRRELADAITGEAAPLAARVFVNRIWKHHFGRAFVGTTSNLGTQAEPPTHPELLDDLSARFIAHDWSIKWLHRELVMSATYRQSSRRDAARDARDPENIWLSRMATKRLDVEAWRDAMLFTADDLITTLGGPPRELTDPQNRRRTLYGTVKRRELTDLLRLHDFPDPVTHVAGREPTTTPLQQLFVLNSAFMQERGAALARRVTGEHPGDPVAQAALAYRLLYGRAAKPAELEAAAEFFESAKADGRTATTVWPLYAQVLLGSNEFIFVD